MSQLQWLCETSVKFVVSETAAAALARHFLEFATVDVENTRKWIANGLELYFFPLILFVYLFVCMRICLFAWVVCLRFEDSVLLAILLAHTHTHTASSSPFSQHANTYICLSF